MGLVLDSSVLIAAERTVEPVGALLARIERDCGQANLVLSAISVVELEHGFHRAQSDELARKRRAWQRGQVIPFPDLLIGSTALHFGYAVATRNARHFLMIPRLEVVTL